MSVTVEEYITEMKQVIADWYPENGDKILPPTMAIIPSLEVERRLHAEVIFVDLDDFSPEIRQAFKRVIPPALVKAEAQAYILFSEAWMTSIKADNKARLDYIKEVGVASLPPDDKIEVVILLVVERNKPAQQFIAKIIRGRDSSRLGEFNPPEIEGEEVKYASVDSRLVIPTW